MLGQQRRGRPGQPGEGEARAPGTSPTPGGRWRRPAGAPSAAQRAASSGSLTENSQGSCRTRRRVHDGRRLVLVPRALVAVADEVVRGQAEGAVRELAGDLDHPVLDTELAGERGDVLRHVLGDRVAHQCAQQHELHAVRVRNAEVAPRQRGRHLRWRQGGPVLQRDVVPGHGREQRLDQRPLHRAAVRPRRPPPRRSRPRRPAPLPRRVAAGSLSRRWATGPDIRTSRQPFEAGTDEGQAGGGVGRLRARRGRAERCVPVAVVAWPLGPRGPTYT